MSKRCNHRLKMLYLRDILLKYTDENHTLNVSDIIKLLEKEYEIEVSRNTVYTDLQALGYSPPERPEPPEDSNNEKGVMEDYGMYVLYGEQKRGYWVGERHFEIHELQLLIDIIHSSRFITAKKAKTLTNKLKTFVSKNNLKKLKRPSYIPNRVKSDNDSVFYGIDNIHDCIANKTRLSFRYFQYDVKKNRVYYKKGKPYIVSPYALLWNDNYYYLLAYECGEMKHFRVDRMESIESLKDRRLGEDVFNDFKLEERLLRVFSMFGGKEERVGLRLHNRLVKAIIDRFGKEILLQPDGNHHFTVYVNVEISDQFYGWLCGFKRSVKIIYPDRVIDDFGEYVSAISQMYKIEKRKREKIEYMKNNKIDV